MKDLSWEELKTYKTQCCDSTWSVEGRLTYVCDSCKEDVTMDIIFLYDALTN